MHTLFYKFSTMHVTNQPQWGPGSQRVKIDLTRRYKNGMRYFIAHQSTNKLWSDFSLLSTLVKRNIMHFIRNK